MNASPRARLLPFLALSLTPQTLLPGTTFVNGYVPKPTVTDVDVVVVGGGFSGLMSAYDLQQAGLDTVVLEAKEIIGGRSRTSSLESGPGLIELGATWINNNTQPDVYALTEQFGLETIVQYTEGDEVFQSIDGEVHRTTPGDDSVEPPEEELFFYGLIHNASQAVDVRDFDKYPADQDVTFAEWLAAYDLWDNLHVRSLAHSLSTSLVGREPEELGAHYLLDYIKSGGSILELGSEDERGAQYLMVKQGTTAIATSLADAMTPGSVRVNTPVKSITQHHHQPNGTSVSSGSSSSSTTRAVTIKTKTGETFTAKKVILAIPLNTYHNIDFSPALPREKDALLSSTQGGNYAKVILTYAGAWWRPAGLVGKFTSVVGPVCFSWETSVPELSQYSLATFVSGDVAAEWFDLPESEKEEAIVEHLAQLVGGGDGGDGNGDSLADKARDVLEINRVEWTMEEYLEGGPTSSMGPGTLRRYGAALREPFGDLHFGGGDTAYEWKGYLEGAVRAGRRVAEEVVDELDGC